MTHAQGEPTKNVDAIDIIVDAIWSGFEAEDNCYTDRNMDVIDTGGYYEVFSMARVAAHVLDVLLTNDVLIDRQVHNSQLAAAWRAGFNEALR